MTIDVSTLTAADVPKRHRMPRVRTGYTLDFTVGGAEFYLTANAHYTERGWQLGEVFWKFGKTGSTAGGLTDAISILLSVGLQYGVPLTTIVDKFRDVAFEPMGMTDDREIPRVTSPMDYIARRLALDFLTTEQRHKLGIFTAAEQS